MPEPRRFRDQKFCLKLECRRASKHDSQRRWYYSEKGAEYRNSEYNQQRVREWRAAHPDYAKLSGGRPRRTSLPKRTLKPVDDKVLASHLTGMALQDLIASQPAMMEAFISSLTEKALQEMIAIASRNFVPINASHSENYPGGRPKQHDRDEEHKDNHQTGDLKYAWHI